MILYDDKHNFLGMSSHTLGFLGYEDVGEFLSMHNDFANLFVNKEGFIYNFDDFNWIDFVLYSGAANKSAIVTLKNGKETKVDLSIKEVYLGHELNGIKKLYSVKLISDNFHEISGVPKNDEAVGGIGGFSLSGLAKTESKKEEKAEIIPEQSNFQNLIEENKDQKIEKSESFILNMDEDTLVPSQTKEQPQTKDEVISNIEDDFKLDFINQEPQEESSDFILTPKEDEAPNIDFLLKTDENQAEKSTPQESDFTLQKIVQQDKAPNIDFLLKTNEEEAVSPKEEVLKETNTEDSKVEIIKEEDKGFKLDFLKMDLTPVSEPEIASENIESDTSAYQEIDNREIIQQIKNDIKEIDTVSEEILSQEIPTMPQVLQPLELEEKTEEHTIQESLSSFQIHENRLLETNKSFTSTLKELFNTKKDSDEEISSINSNDETFSFRLKNDNHVEEQDIEKEVENKLEIIPREEDASISETIPQEAYEEEISFSSLSALGLSPDDEFDLLSDFITDAKESIDTMEQFIETKDFDKINYSLVKIKSSAEILNLDAIINGTSNIRKHCITENSEKVIQETKKLKENIKLLAKQLEVTAL